MTDGPDFLVYRKERISIGVRVRSYLEDDAPSFYRATDGKKRFSRATFEAIEGSRKQSVKKVVIHHDGMSTAEGCYSVLYQRGLSSHLLINHDGVVLQPLDLSDTAWHADPFNKDSVGLDMNNPVRPNRVKDPTERGVFQGEINGGRVASLGYTEPQYESLIAVLNGLFKIFPGIKREAPIGEDGKVLRSKLVNLEFAGIVGHLHVSASKWDPGPGFDWERVLIGVRGNQTYFPVTLPGHPNLATVPKKKALSYAEGYFRNTENGRGGFFPIGTNQAWHTGVHLHTKEGTPVLAPLSGHVVVARMIDDEKMGSPNVVVLRHTAEVDGSERTFFSIMSHLQKPELGVDSAIPWIRRYASAPGPGAPERGDGDVPLAAPGYLAFRQGFVSLCEVEIKAGEIVGHTGSFSEATDGSEMAPLLDFGLISSKPVFPPSDTTFEVVDDDDDAGLLCNSRAVWKRVTTRPEELRGLVEGGYPLAPAEIRSFFANEQPASALRWLCVRHVTEWSDKTDFGGLFGGGINFEWHLRTEARRYVDRIRKFLWWDENVSKHLKFQEDRLVYCYHPVALLTLLAMGEARKALRPGENGPETELSGDELAKARRADQEYERESGRDQSHEDIRYEGAEGADLYNVEEPDPEEEGWMRWEQGEWDRE